MTATEKAIRHELAGLCEKVDRELDGHPRWFGFAGPLRVISIEPVDLGGKQ